MADRLVIYKGALRLLGDAHSLSSLTEVGPAREHLDAAWRPTGDYMLARGFWNFALRPVELSHDTDTEPLFGRTYSFVKPDDWVRTQSISQDGRLDCGYEDYDDVGNYWFADIDPIYVNYVSDDDAYGWNVGAWRQPFAKAFEAYLAYECGLPISSDRGNRSDMFTLFKKLLAEAKSLDAVDERVQRKPVGRLVRSRSFNSNSDRRYT
jgi:hypothetical protein